MVSFYVVLGVKQKASVEDIRAAFKRQALALHPDKGGTPAQFHEVMTAFQNLTDAECRARHDDQLEAMRTSEVVINSRKRPRDSPSVLTVKERKRKKVDRPGGIRPGKCASGSTVSKTPREASVTEPEMHSSESRQSSKFKLRKEKRDPLAQLFRLLQQLSAKQRRTAIQKKFSEAQRLLFEQWILARRIAMTLPEKQEQEQMQYKQLRINERDSREDKRAEMAAHQTSNLQHVWEKTTKDVNGQVASKQQVCNQTDRKQTEGKRSASKQKVTRHTETSQSEKGLVKTAVVKATPARKVQTMRSGLGKEHRRTTDESDSMGIISRTGPGPGRIRGIASEVKQGQVWYRSTTTLGMIQLVSRKVRDLAQAVDFLVILTNIKQCVITKMVDDSCASTMDENFQSLEYKFQKALHATLHEHGCDAEKDLGLRFTVCVPTKWWIGTNLRTPWFRMSELQRGLQTWRQLREARGEVRCGRHNFRSSSPKQLQSTWTQVRRAYLESLEEKGHTQATAAARLDALEEAHRPWLEREIERWNRTAMVREERLQRTIMAAEQRQGRREQRDMAQADAASRVAERLAKQKERGVARIERHIDQWLSRWARQSRAQEQQRKKGTL